MQAREGDPLRLFLAFMEPLDPAEPTKPSWTPPDGDESLLLAVRSSAAAFACGRTITNDDGDVGGPKVMLPPAA